MKVPGLVQRVWSRIDDRIVRPAAHRRYFTDLVRQTNNFADVRWMGHPIWQNVLDLWVMQEALVEVRPALVIECGTNRGGSAMYYANLMDLMGSGEVISIDVTSMHELSHPRVTWMLGGSTSAAVVERVRARVERTRGPVFVVLDSDHSQVHVRRELELYAPLVTRGSYCLVQDGVIDTLPAFAAGRPGPLPAVAEFLRHDPRFAIDEARCSRFLISHHPKGWLRRITD
jgi:cephalosporin hydroxylase